MDDDRRDQPAVLGRLGARDGRGVVTMTDRFDTDVDDLWSALTEPDRLARWLGEVEGDLRLGGSFRASFFASGWEGTGRIEMCEAPHRFRVVTSSADAPVDHVIEATLTADGEMTLLVVEERGMPLEHLADYGAGIQVHVEDLGAHVAGRGVDEARPRWRAILPAYEDLAATVITGIGTTGSEAR